MIHTISNEEAGFVIYEFTEAEYNKVSEIFKRILCVMGTKLGNKSYLYLITNCRYTFFLAPKY